MYVAAQIDGQFVDFRYRLGPNGPIASSIFVQPSKFADGDTPIMMGEITIDDVRAYWLPNHTGEIVKFFELKEMEDPST